MLVGCLRGGLGNPSYIEQNRYRIHTATLPRSHVDELSFLNMTKLLEQAIERLSLLPETMQDTAACALMFQLDSQEDFEVCP